MAVRRAGIVHAAANAAALTLYASLAGGAAARGSPADRNRSWASGAPARSWEQAGFLGGHLSFAQGRRTRPDGLRPRTARVDSRRSTHHSSRIGEPMRIVVEETPVLVLLSDDRVFAIHDRCSHRGCSLSNGELEGDEIVCPCHRIALRLA